jgi:hypothetical protein
LQQGAGSTSGVLVHPFAAQASGEDWELSTTIVRELGSD